MMPRPFRSFAVPLAAAWLCLLAGCSVNPATGERNFTGFMSPEKEIQIGRQEHPKIQNQFGGAYQDRAIQSYVNDIGQALARHSELPNLKFTFTVLNSDVVNAFALPGGYVYVTRGLIALASNEAELAGVIAHEIGHVTARHAAQRYSTTMATQIGLGVLGVFAGGGIAEVGGAIAGPALKAYSRDQEFESDLLGIRYMNRAGYDPRAMSTFLAKMQAHSQIEAKLAGRQGADQYNIMSTHPRTADRVARAMETAAGTVPPVADPRLGVRDFMARIDGLLYGDDPAQGFVRGRSFIHPTLGFRFDVPPDFRMRNSPTKVAASHPNGALIVFDQAGKPFSGSMTQYVGKVWGRTAKLQGLTPIRVSGFDAATAITRMKTNRGTLDIRLVAVRWPEATIYRFLFATPPERTAAFSRGFQDTTYSLRPLPAGQASSFRPLRVVTYRIKRGDTVASLADRMAVRELRRERFLALNGLRPDSRLRPGALIKLIGQ